MVSLTIANWRRTLPTLVLLQLLSALDTFLSLMSSSLHGSTLQICCAQAC